MKEIVMNIKVEAILLSAWLGEGGRDAVGVKSRLLVDGLKARVLADLFFSFRSFLFFGGNVSFSFFLFILSHSCQF